MLGELEKIWSFLRSKIPTKIFYVKDVEEIFDSIRTLLHSREISSPSEFLIISGRMGYEVIGRSLEEKLSSEVSRENIKKLIIDKEYFDKKIIDEEIIGKLLRSINNIVVIGVGGGFVLDIAKYVASYTRNKDLVLIPTTMSSNAIMSPFSVIRAENRIEAFKTIYPKTVLICLDILSNVPKRHIASGFADSLAKYTALYDLRLSYWFSDLEYDRSLFKIARRLTSILINEAHHFVGRSKESIENLLIAELIDGALMGLSGTTRIVAGSEHLIALALTMLSPQGLHGEYVGVGTIISSYIQGRKWSLIRDILLRASAPTNIHQLNLEEKVLIEAVKKAPDMRNWYTILGRFRDERKIREVLKESRVIE